MTREQPECWDRSHKLRKTSDYDLVKGGGTPLRGRFCLLLALSRPGPTQIGFVASKKSVGGAVQRNRARRRMREVVRRRWPLMEHAGLGLAFIAYRGVNQATHEALVADIERLLGVAGALPPTTAGEMHGP